MAIIITDTKIKEDVMIEMVKDETKRDVLIPALYLPGSDG